jgi:Asp-tRNA(Asn)/Glu-tRNA(Gln) amidotransferase A subunit family amidase
MPLSCSLDHVGPLARAVRELAATLPFGTEPLDFLSALEAEAVEQKA